MLDERTALDGFMLGAGRGGNRSQVFMVLGACGFATLIYLVIGIASAPWYLDDSYPTVTSSESSSTGCDWQRGGQYEIEVDGNHYTGCSGAANKCAGWDPVEIAYDPSDPSQCRVAQNVDSLSPYERTTVLIAFSLWLVGLAGVTFTLSNKARMKAIADGDTTLPDKFKRLQVMSWVCLALAVLTINATAIFALV